MGKQHLQVCWGYCNSQLCHLDCGARAKFQRLMDQVLRGTEAYAGVYLDDITINGDTWD